MDLACVTAATLRQWALDFEGNLNRTLESIEKSKIAGARLRLGPELELCGYGCEDHFLEDDTCMHCWESLSQILQDGRTFGILLDIGMPVVHKSVRYNARVYCLSGKILLIRPKTALADDGNQRESRWFAAWDKGPVLETFALPECIQQTTAPIGLGVINCRDAVVASESCEEMWTPQAPHIDLSLDGVEIFTNGSGSFHQLRKLQERLDIILSGTKRTGGVYIYANQAGCDGGRLYYDGCSLIAVNGSLVGLGEQFSLSEVEVTVSRVSLQQVRDFRGASPSRSSQASRSRVVFPRVDADIYLTSQGNLSLGPSRSFLATSKIVSPMEEIALGPAMWLWDFLVRSGARGFFVPLSGGADSASVAAIVGSMCQVVMKRIHEKDENLKINLSKVLRLASSDPKFPKSHQQLANLLLHTCYMGTVNSSEATRARATAVAADIGAFHHATEIDQITNAFVTVFEGITNRKPAFRNDSPESDTSGGSHVEDLALQNIQARSRMCLSYLLASLFPWSRDLDASTAPGAVRPPGQPGFLLVLATGNVDECLRGYLTKYDCSSGDINPIGGIAKVDIFDFLNWASRNDTLGYSSLKNVVEAPPTAELRPNSGGDQHSQLDEVEMGMSYAELRHFGTLRKIHRCGPVSMFVRLCSEWSPISPHDVAEKVKRFFRFYAINRHKATTITPSYHAEAYSPDDNRFDLRPFLYPTTFATQFRKIDFLISRMAS